MLASVLTTILFSFSIIFGARSAKLLGPRVANLSRMTLATVLLAIWAHAFGGGLSGSGLPWFFLSGVVGFGLGDMSLFGALPRIGPRLAILLTQCVAAPLAAFFEWVWLGTTLSARELGCAALVLGGVALALSPDRGEIVARRTFWIGVLFGIGSALGQALGAVISRKANDVGMAEHLVIDGGTAAYQRALGGVLLTWAASFLLLRPRSANGRVSVPWREGAPLILANALAGPTVGVGFYQWALQTTPSGIVLPIVATSPLMTMLLSWWLDGVRPTRRACFGGAIAVGGVIALQLVQGRS